MQEISYQVFDKISGLPIENMGDRYIRDKAVELEKPHSEVFQELKQEIDNIGVKYMIVLGEEKVVPVSSDYFHPFLVNYYDEYCEARESLGV